MENSRLNVAGPGLVRMLVLIVIFPRVRAAEGGVTMLRDRGGFERVQRGGEQAEAIIVGCIPLNVVLSFVLFVCSLSSLSALRLLFVL